MKPRGFGKDFVMSNRLLGSAIQIMVMAIVVAVILLFLGVGMLIIVHICIVGIAFRNPGNFDRTSNNSSSRNFRMSQISQDDLQKLPCYDYATKDKGSGSPVDCAVCLENFKMGEKCRLLPQCRHSFHAECVDSWLLRNPICPICRTSADDGSSKARLPLGLGDQESGSRSSENVAQSRHFDDVTIEILRDNQIREGNNGHESRENQTNSSSAIETTTIPTT